MKTTDEIIEYLYPGARYLDRKVPSEYELLELKKKISKVTGLSSEKFNDKTSKRTHVMSRQLLAVLLRLFTNLSLAEIGTAAGGKDHATVMFSIKNVANLYETDKKYRDKFNKLIAEAETIFRKGALEKPVRKIETGLSKEAWKYAYSLLLGNKVDIHPVEKVPVKLINEIAMLKDLLRDRERDIRLLKGQVDRARIRNSYEYVD
jgi:hypothetical protein